MDTKENKLIIFETEDKEISLKVHLEDETVWLNQQQMSKLFQKARRTIGEHISNALKEELAGQVVWRNFRLTTKHGALPNKQQTRNVKYYNLDVIISVGYRVKSNRGVEFRK